MTALHLVQVSRPVSWGEMDAFGHLNNVHYFRYVEDARIAFLDSLNFFSSSLYSVILKNECEYRRPVIYPDTLKTTCHITHVGQSSFSMQYDVWSEQQQCLVAQANSIIVLVDQETFKKQSIPLSMRNHLENHLSQYMEEQSHDHEK